MLFTLCTCRVITSIVASSEPIFSKNRWSAWRYNMQVVFFRSKLFEGEEGLLPFLRKWCRTDSGTSDQSRTSNVVTVCLTSTSFLESDEEETWFESDCFGCKLIIFKLIQRNDFTSLHLQVGIARRRVAPFLFRAAPLDRTVLSSSTWKTVVSVLPPPAV